MSKQLPHTLYIHVEDAETDEAFLSLDEELSDIAVETGKRMLVGEYVLQRKVEIITETKIVTEVG